MKIVANVLMVLALSTTAAAAASPSQWWHDQYNLDHSTYAQEPLLVLTCRSHYQCREAHQLLGLINRKFGGGDGVGLRLLLQHMQTRTWFEFVSGVGYGG